MPLGSHISISGGVDKAITRGSEVGCEVMQIFVKSSNQWRAKELSEDEIARYKTNKAEAAITTVVAHGSYLVNLAGTDRSLYTKSINATLIELERCERLKIPYLIIHPGSHLGKGEEFGLKRIAESLNNIFQKMKGDQVSILLETTAGQGASLGCRFEHLAEIMERVETKSRIGVCLDTCHVFAAGYDIRTRKGYLKTMREFDQLVGLEKLKAFHVNDSKRDFNSMVDRHEHIGKGYIGLEAFSCLMNDRRFKKTPMILETPKGKDYAEDKVNMRVLHRLVKK